jgi:hypothetical protein
MKLIIEARVECTEQLGLTLEEGRALLAGAVGAHIQPHGAVACYAILLPSMLHSVVPQG